VFVTHDGPVAVMFGRYENAGALSSLVNRDIHGRLSPLTYEARRGWIASPRTRREPFRRFRYRGLELRLV
jgi:hypothetical protein